MGTINFGMSRKFNITIVFLVLLLLDSGGQLIIAQENKQMYMFQIEGNNYIKKSYDKGSGFKGSQIFKVGKIEKEKEKLSMAWKMYSYDKNNHLIDSAVANYYCKPAAGEVLMNIIPFTEFGTNRTVKIELNSGNRIYPSTWLINKPLSDILLSISFEEGVLAKFGTNSKIRIYDRIISAYDKLKNTFTIIAKVEVLAYVFGIRIRRLEFALEETMHPKKGMVKQFFKGVAGDFFTINLKQ